MSRLMSITFFARYIFEVGIDPRKTRKYLAPRKFGAIRYVDYTRQNLTLAAHARRGLIMNDIT